MAINIELILHAIGSIIANLDINIPSSFAYLIHTGEFLVKNQ